MYVCMYVWMYGWMDGWMDDGWMDGCMRACMHVCMYVCIKNFNYVHYMQFVATDFETCIQITHQEQCRMLQSTCADHAHIWPDT